MIVHFIGSKSKIVDQIEYYRKISTHIKSLGHTLAYDWIERVYTLTREAQFKSSSQSWAQVDKEIAIAITQSDVVIIEVTSSSFFTGFQAAQAIAQKKPMLVLARDEAPVIIAGLSTPTGFIKSVTYNDKNLGAVIQDFLDENIIDTKDLRFNFFLDRPTYNYLRWISSKTGKTKAEIVRSLLQKEMKHED